MHTFLKLSTSAGPSSTSKTQKSGIGNDGTAEKNKKNLAQHRRPIVPFGRRDRILLVGEGERFVFSYFPTAFQNFSNFLMVFFEASRALQSMLFSLFTSV
jgi:25S rRNA (uracil2634-N3)-methyltransferase